MSTTRFLIIGPSWFNNYYLLMKQISNYVTTGSALLTCGNTKGTDVLVDKYCQYHKCFAEHYPLKYRTVEAMERRNKKLLDYTGFQIFFDDGEKGTVRYLRTLCDVYKSQHIVVDISKEDNISLNWRFKDVNTELKDMCDDYGSIKSNTEIIVSDFIETIIRDTTSEEELLKLDADMFEESNEPRYDGILRWLLINARSDIDEQLAIKRKQLEERSSEHLSTAGRLYHFWRKKDPSGQICTKSGLLVANGFNDVVTVNNKVYLELLEKHIVRKNYWKPGVDMYEADDEDAPCIYYSTKDTSNTEVLLCRQTFDEYGFKIGRWYICVNNLREE